MRLVRDDNDIVPLAIRAGNVLIEFVNQTENKPMVLAEQRLQILARFGPRRLVVRYAAANEGAKNLIVEIIPVRHDDEREVSRHDAPDFLREKCHRVRLTASLRVPEDTKPAQIRVCSLYQRKFSSASSSTTNLSISFPLPVWDRQPRAMAFGNGVRKQPLLRRI